MTVRAVLFDLDGTLVDSVPGLTLGINTVMASIRMRPFTEAEISKMVGKGVRVLIEKVLDARGVYPTDQTVDAIIRKYAAVMVENETVSKAAFYPGVLDSIARLREAGIKVAVVTNKIRSMTESFLTKNGMMDMFDAVVCGDDTRNPKPAGDMLVLACRKLGVEVGEAVMVGDSRNDAQAARAAGMPVYLVTTGYNEGVPIEKWAKTNGFEMVCSGIAEVAGDILGK